MKKEQFLRELEALLQDLPENERVEALQYYRDYFDDAGPENEEKILEELGSPEKVAGTIRDGVDEDQKFGPGENGAQQPPQPGSVQPQTKKSPNGWKITTIVLLCLLLAPVIMPLAGVVLAILVAAVVTVIGILLAIAAAAVGLLIGGAALVVVGLARIFLFPAAALLLTGAGLLVFALGILAAIAIIWCAVKAVPWLIRGIVKLVQLPFRKKKQPQAA